MQHWRQSDIAERLRFAIAEPGAHGAGISARRLDQFRNRTGEPGFGLVAKSAGVVPVLRKLSVVKHRLAE
jgi:hypothetical protein